MAEEYKPFIVLEALYNNSDSMTDYYEPRRTLRKWTLCPMPGKILTEKKLRRILDDLPGWLRRLKWEYLPAKRWSMTSQPYGALDSEGVGLLVKTYYSGEAGIWMSLTMEHHAEAELATDIPTRREDVKTIVDAHNRKYEEDRAYYNSPEYKSIQAKREAENIMRSHAIIGAKGLEILTPEKKIEKLMEIDEVRQAAKIDKKYWSKFTLDL